MLMGCAGERVARGWLNRGVRSFKTAYIQERISPARRHTWRCRRRSKQATPTKCQATATAAPAQVSRGSKADMLLEQDFPKPGEEQQTLKQSFTVAGVGLHSGEYALVRVRPANAGEGRYFVRVPEGTNRALHEQSQAYAAAQHKDSGERLQQQEDDAEERMVTDFLGYLSAQDEGYDGTFLQYMNEQLELRQPTPAPEEPMDEEVKPRSADEPFVAATLDNATAFPEDDALFTTLSTAGISIHGAEMLMAALEACGVDNARIEIEEGEEPPIYDGSSMGWAMDIQLAGVRPAPSPANGEHVPRVTLAPQKMVTVRKGGSFVTLIPHAGTRITYGIDHTADAPVIGRQWLTWDVQQDEHFRWTIAPARPYVTSPKLAFMRRAEGFFKGAPDDAINIANGNVWHGDTVEEDEENNFFNSALNETAIVTDGEELKELESSEDLGDREGREDREEREGHRDMQDRFVEDEPVRRRLLELVGHLALLAEGGNAGLPQGHIIAYQAPHSLHLDFARAVKKVCSM